MSICREEPLLLTFQISLEKQNMAVLVLVAVVLAINKANDIINYDNNNDKTTKSVTTKEL